jgi:O-methyltransferase
MPKSQEIINQVSDLELETIIHELGYTLSSEISGDIVEFGCYAGETSLEIAQFLKSANSSKTLYLYDSFEGLPEKHEHDHSPLGKDFTSGKLSATKSSVLNKFKKANLPTPKIKKAWFKDLKQTDLPDKISFAFLDGDFYESIKDSLNLVLPKMSKNSKVLIHDYKNPALPGVMRAVDEQTKIIVNKTIDTLAIISIQ